MAVTITAAALKRKCLIAKGLGKAENVLLTQAEAASLLKALDSFEKMPAALQTRLSDHELRFKAQLGIDLQRIANEVLDHVGRQPLATAPAQLAITLTSQLHQLSEAYALPRVTALSDLAAYTQSISEQTEYAQTLGPVSSSPEAKTASILVENSSLPNRCKHALAAGGFKTLADVLKVTGSELARLPNMGKLSMFHLSAWAGMYGHNLSDDVQAR